MFQEPAVIGKIGQPFGVKGWVRVNSFCEPPENILNYGDSNWWVRRPLNGFRAAVDTSVLESGIQKIKVKHVKPHGKGFVVAIDGIADRDQALDLRGAEIIIEREALPDLPSDDYYWYQLEGLTVKAVTGEVLGRLAQMMETGANDVMIVQPTDGSLDNRKRLIPYLFGSVVKSVDLAEQTLIVDWDLDF